MSEPRTRVGIKDDLKDVPTVEICGDDQGNIWFLPCKNSREIRVQISLIEIVTEDDCKNIRRRAEEFIAAWPEQVNDDPNFRCVLPDAKIGEFYLRSYFGHVWGPFSGLQGVLDTYEAQGYTLVDKRP